MALKRMTIGQVEQTTSGSRCIHIFFLIADSILALQTEIFVFGQWVDVCDCETRVGFHLEHAGILKEALRFGITNGGIT